MINAHGRQVWKCLGFPKAQTPGVSGLLLRPLDSQKKNLAE